MHVVGTGAVPIESTCLSHPGNETFDEYDFPPALPIMGMLDYSQDGQYAPGIQAKVTGEVLRWHHVNGVQAIPAKEYIEKLERENQILKQQVSSRPWASCRQAANTVLDKPSVQDCVGTDTGVDTAVCACCWEFTSQLSERA